jgi:glycosyltransferase involved in cell wall biosynthesis
LERKGIPYQYDFQDKNTYLSKPSSFDCVLVFADPMNPSFHKIDPSTSKSSVVVININEDNEKILSSNLNLKKAVVNKLKSFSKTVSFCKNSSVNRFLVDNGIDHVFINNFSRDVMNSPSNKSLTKEKLGIKKKIMIYHAAIEPSKNQILLVEEFCKSNASKEYDLVLIGSSRNSYSQKYYNTLATLIKERGNVHLFKSTSDQEIITSMRKMSNVFIIPSKSEGLPVTILEAMSANLFWISTPVGGVPGTLGELTGGYIFNHPSFNHEDIDVALSNLNKKSREEWEMFFSKEVGCQNYYNLIKELV